MRANLAARILVMATGAWFAACSTVVLVDEPAESAYAGYGTVVTLPFVTNRRYESDGEGNRRYGAEHDVLSGGRCVVGFEEDNWRGEMIRVEITSVDAALPAVESPPLVLYVHGYSESFAKSCARAALLEERLGLDQRLLLFSWPSRNYLTYEQDADELEASVDRLNELLSLLADRVGYERIVIMAHSMGARGVMEALRRRSDVAPRFSGIVMVAPDISRKEFLDNIPVLLDRAVDITVYMSDNDRALWLSTTVNISGRLGNAAELPVDIKELNFVDITPTGTTHFSGHLYHLHNPAAIEDLRAVLGTLAESVDRRWHRQPTGAPGFWKLDGAAD
jgi:pimeloyl-ACP methyl ester carboxylesterase